MSKIKTKFENLIASIKETAVDFTTLEVTTMTGDISNLASNEGKFDAKNLISQMSDADGVMNQKIKIIAHSHIDFDQDTLLFVKEKLEDSEEKLFLMHKTAVENAQKSRENMLRFIKEIITGD